MTPLEHLEMAVGAELQAQGGILDRLDYRRIRQLGVRLRNIPAPSDDWDLPSSSLQGWVGSYDASLEIVRIMAEAGLERLLRSHSSEIREALSVEILPCIDAAIAGRPALDMLVKRAKDEDLVRRVDFTNRAAEAPSREALAEYLVVQLDVGVTWPERPKVDERVGMRRLKLGALIGQMALGGALAAANVSLGVVAGVLSSIPAIVGNVPIAAGMIGSTYTGLNGLFSALDKVADALKTRGPGAA